MPTGSMASQLEGWHGTSSVTATKKHNIRNKGAQENISGWDGHQWPEKSNCKESLE